MKHLNIQKQEKKIREVSLHIYDAAANATKKVDLGNYNDFYIARLQWTNDNNTLSAQVLNRHQDNLDLLFVDGTTGSCKSGFE